MRALISNLKSKSWPKGFKRFYRNPLDSNKSSNTFHPSFLTSYLKPASIYEPQFLGNKTIVRKTDLYCTMWIIKSPVSIAIKINKLFDGALFEIKIGKRDQSIWRIFAGVDNSNCTNDIYLYCLYAFMHIIYQIAFTEVI